MYPPGPQGWELITTIFRLQRDPLGTLMELTDRFGDVVAYRFGPFPVVLLNHPEAAMRALQDNHPNYGKRHSPFYRMLRHFLGDGLLTSDGDFWLRQRRLAQPAFQRKKIEALEPMITSCTQDLVRGWRQLAPGSRLDMAHEMMQLTLRIVGLALFSQDLSQTGSSVGQALDELQVQMSQRFSSLLPLPPVLPTLRDRRFRAAREGLRVLALELVRKRRSSSDRPNDLLTSLLEAQDPETGERMSDDQICSELMTFILAGHETTANTLTWCLYLLSLHPDVRRRLEAELLEQSQALCDRVILESLRLYPPAWVYGRRSFGPDTLRGFQIGTNQLVTVSPYVLHRNPQFWPNPEGFDPDRFLQDPPRGAFLPFAAGPRQCIGNHFALFEARLILSTLVSQVRVNVVRGSRVEPEPLITLRPRGGLWCTLEFR